MNIEEINQNLMDLLKEVSEKNVNEEYRNIFLKFCEEIIYAHEYPVYLGIDDNGEPKRYSRNIEGYLTVKKLKDLDQVFQMFNAFMNTREYILEQLESMR